MVPRTRLSVAVLWFRWLVAGLSPRRPGFNPTPDNVGFVVDKVAVAGVSVRVLRSFPRQCCILCVFVVSFVYLLYSYVYLLNYVCLDILTLDAGLLARSQYPEGPATGHLDTRFSWFPCVYKRMLRWFPSFQVATTWLSCSPPDLNFLVTFFHICVHVK